MIVLRRGCRYGKVNNSSEELGIKNVDSTETIVMLNLGYCSGIHKECFIQTYSNVRFYRIE